MTGTQPDYIFRILEYRAMLGSEMARTTSPMTTSNARTTSATRPTVAIYISRIFRYRAISGKDFTTSAATSAKSSDIIKRRIMFWSPFQQVGTRQ